MEAISRNRRAAGRDCHAVSKPFKRRLIPGALIGVPVIFLVAGLYAFVPKPITDLRIVSVQSIPATTLPRVVSVRDRLIDHHETVWRITVSSSADWVDEVRRYELNSYALVIRCDRPDYELLAFGPFIGARTISALAPEFSQVTRQQGARRYDIYVPAIAYYTSDASFSARLPAYNLGADRVSLCIRLVGVTDTGHSARSNEVRLRFKGSTSWNARR